MISFGWKRYGLIPHINRMYDSHTYYWGESPIRVITPKNKYPRQFEILMGIDASELFAKHLKQQLK